MNLKQAWYLNNASTSLLSKARPGLVRLYGKAAYDDLGFFHPWEMTFFWAYKGWRDERSRFKDNIQYIKERCQPDSLRILAHSGAISPNEPNYPQLMREVIEYIYNEGSMRVGLTIIGDRPNYNPLTLANTLADIILERPHMFMYSEMANEYSVNTKVDIYTMQLMAKLFRTRGVRNILALSSPGDFAALLTASADCDGFSVHTDRAELDYKWRQVRQGWDFQAIPKAGLDNEGPGINSSVGSNNNPLQLAMKRAISHMSGAPLVTLHVGDMVNGVEDPAYNRHPNIWQVRNIENICSAFRNIAKLLPDQVENWVKANSGWNPPLPVSPYQPDAYWPYVPDHGVNKMYSAYSNGKWIQMPIGVLRYANVSPSYPVSNTKVFDPLSLSQVTFDGSRLEGRDDTMAAYIMTGEM